MEHYKKIKGYDNYLISDQGRVFSYKRSIFLKPRKNQKGYLNVNLCKNGIVKNHKIHRLVALAFIPNTENKPTVNHMDSDRTNNFVENLEWNTHSENTQHGYDFGLKKPPCLKGIKNGRAKLSENQVLEIRRLHKTGNYIHKDLGEMFGVDNSHICKIVNRKKWTHI